MRKFSLFSLTIGLPIVVAILCTLYSARTASMRSHAANVFHKSIDNEINTKYSTGIDVLVAAYGPTGAAEIVQAKANTTDTIAFDGVSRLVKSVHKTKEWTGLDPPETGYSDGVVLQDFTHATGAVWDGPMGTRISTIRFADDKLIISLYGNLQLGTSTQMIPKEQAEDYVIPWPKGSAPTPGSLYDAVVARHAHGE